MNQHLRFLVITFYEVAINVLPFRHDTSLRADLIVVLLAAIALVIVFSHREELLRFRHTFAGMYIILGTVGFLLARDDPQGSTPLVALLVYGGLGTAPLLIPGYTRRVLYHIGAIRPAREPGLLEAFALLPSFVPLEIDRLRDAVRYRLTKRSSGIVQWWSIPIQLTIAYVVFMASRMQCLYAAITNRQYHVQTYAPPIRSNLLELAGLALIVLYLSLVYVGVLR